MTQTCHIYLIDDEPDVTDSLKWLLETINYPSQAFNDPRIFLDHYQDVRWPCVIVTDLRMPFHSGLDLLDFQKMHHRVDPVVLLTGHGDVRTAVRAMKLGAFDFLTKPFNPQEFLDCINRATDQAHTLWREADQNRAVAQKVDTLSRRERDVFERMRIGASTKQIAKDLAISPKTVDVHRSNILRKLGVRSAQQLTSQYGSVTAPKVA